MGTSRSPQILGRRGRSCRRTITGTIEQFVYEQGVVPIGEEGGGDVILHEKLMYFEVIASSKLFERSV